jgi:NTP pyrophosphatase (non-canonical NTP hydrolase)
MSALTLDCCEPLLRRAAAAEERYGPFASTHEALGVASEEWDELRDAIRANDIEAIRSEALDLAGVLVRLWAQLGEDEAMRKRSGK